MDVFRAWLAVVAFSMPLVSSGARLADSSSLSNKVVIAEIGPALEASGFEAIDITTDYIHSGLPDSERLKAALGNPLFATPLFDEPVSRQELDIPDTKEALSRIKRYVLLAYSSPEQANAALKILMVDGLMRSAAIDGPLMSSAVPSDQHYVALRQPQWIQLNAPAAWSETSGTAHVAVLDNGIYTLHHDLLFNFRPQFSRNAAVQNTGFGGINTDRKNVDERYYPTTLTPTYSGHGSHVAGIIAATTGDPAPFAAFPLTPGGVAAGVAGGCWYCSLHIIKVAGSPHSLTMSHVAVGLIWAARRGAQVANMSFGANSIVFPPIAHACPSGNTGVQALCDAITLANARQMVLVGAAGNSNLSGEIDFPSSDPRVIPVGAVDGLGARWQQIGMNGSTDLIGSNRGTDLLNRGVVAPGVNIYSTVYPGYDWNPNIACGDNFFSHVQSGPSTLTYTADNLFFVGHGSCTGTSMAAPHVSAIVGLMRTVNPLESVSSVQNKLRGASSRSLAGLAANAELGAGIPDALSAVSAMLATTNRLTPLFSLSEGITYQNSFYTTNPQMAAAALLGTILPSQCLVTGDPCPSYATFGTNVAIGGGPYLAPSTSTQLKSDLWIFTTPKNPKSTSVLLAPIFRLSYYCADTSSIKPLCAGRPHDVDHTYVTTWLEVQNKITDGYKYDGVEGFIYPASFPAPLGTTEIWRGYDAVKHDTILLSGAATVGYPSYAPFTLIGRAYSNAGSRPTIP